MILAIILIPFFGGSLVYFVRRIWLRDFVLLASAGLHLVLSFASLFTKNNTEFWGMLTLDPLGHYFLCVMSTLFFISSIYAVSYVKNENTTQLKDEEEEGFIFADSPKRLFYSAYLIFCGTMSVVCAASHLGILWIAIEATTFASAPLVYYYHNRRSLEATWKYVMVCSVGIGFSLIGNLLLMVAFNDYLSDGLHLSKLLHEAQSSRKEILLIAFVFFLVGYGTKAGLAPMHGWLPEAHGEAPAFVSALLSGALLNCAYLGIFRIQKICCQAGIGLTTGKLMIFLGLLSVIVAAVFMITQKDYKRMLAYSSVEHMGIAVIGAGIGGTGIIAAMLHILNHSFAKGMLFLTSGNILSAYGSKKISEVSNMLKVIPTTGFLWLAGLLSICAIPPAGLFLSEFLLFKELFRHKQYLVVAVLFIALLIIFSVMLITGLEMVFGTNRTEKIYQSCRESILRIITPIFLFLILLLAGIYIPDFLISYLSEIARGFQI